MKKDTNSKKPKPIKEKNSAASALAKLRAEKIGPKRCSEIAKKGAAARWKKK